jgi:hypothetical protein
MGVRSREIDEFADDFDGVEAELFGPDDNVERPTPVINKGTKPRGKRWRSVEEYNEWKRLKSRLGDEEVDWDDF